MRPMWPVCRGWPLCVLFVAGKCGQSPTGVATMTAMSELPVGDGHQVIHLGGEAAVVVPLEEYRRLRDLERLAGLLELVDLEDAAVLADYRRRKGAGAVELVTHDEVRRRFGLTDQ